MVSFGGTVQAIEPKTGEDSSVEIPTSCGVTNEEAYKAEEQLLGKSQTRKVDKTVNNGDEVKEMHANPEEDECQ